MVRSKLFLILIGFLAFAIVVVVFMLSFAELPNKENNGFTRNYLSDPVELKFESINKLVSRISGVTDSCIYLSGQHPGWVLKVDYKLSKIDTLRYGIEGSTSLRDPAIIIDYPNIYMYATDIPLMLKGNVDSFIVDTMRLRTAVITRTAQISPDKLIIRGIDVSQTKQEFKLIDCKTGEIIRTNQLFPVQQFGGFELDGGLEYDKFSGKIFYIQMFSNDMSCLDTNLNLLYKSKTIDTVQVSSVKIGLREEGGTTKVMAQKPRQIVNRDFTVYKDIIYNISGLRSDNEKLTDFNKIYPIDLYSGSNGKYIGSIKLPKREGKQLLDIKVIEDIIVVLYESGYCAVFKMTGIEV